MEKNIPLSFCMGWGKDAVGGGLLMLGECTNDVFHAFAK